MICHAYLLLGWLVHHRLVVLTCVERLCAGALGDFVCSCQVRYPNYYGIDLPRQSDLLAYGLEEEEIAEAIGADGVVFQVRWPWLPVCSSISWRPLQRLRFV